MKDQIGWCVFSYILQLLLDPGEASSGKDDKQRGGQHAGAGGDREGVGQGGQDGQGESHHQPKGKEEGLWERRRLPAQKIFNIGALYKNDMVHCAVVYLALMNGCMFCVCLSIYIAYNLVGSARSSDIDDVLV